MPISKESLKEAEIPEFVLAVQLFHTIPNITQGQSQLLAQTLVEMFGGNSQDVKPEVPTTQQLIQEMDTSGLSNLVLRLGDRLEELDTLMSSLTRLREILQSNYNELKDGLLGPLAPES